MLAPAQHFGTTYNETEAILRAFLQVTADRDFETLSRIVKIRAEAGPAEVFWTDILQRFRLVLENNTPSPLSFDFGLELFNNVIRSGNFKLLDLHRQIYWTKEGYAREKWSSDHPPPARDESEPPEVDYGEDDLISIGDSEYTASHVDPDVTLPNKGSRPTAASVMGSEENARPRTSAVLPPARARDTQPVASRTRRRSRSLGPSDPPAAGTDVDIDSLLRRIESPRDRAKRARAVSRAPRADSPQHAATTQPYAQPERYQPPVTLAPSAFSDSERQSDLEQPQSEFQRMREEWNRDLLRLEEPDVSRLPPEARQTALKASVICSSTSAEIKRMASQGIERIPLDVRIEILKNRYVDLAKVYRFEPHQAHDALENLDLPDNFRTIFAKSSAKEGDIPHLADWLTAWNQVESFTLRFYRWRKEEFRFYSDFILDLATRNPHRWSRIAAWDREFRSRLGQAGGHYSLLDARHDSVSLVAHFMHHTEYKRGKTTPSKDARPSKSVGGNRPICRNFNIGKEHDNKACRYTHSCSNCGESGHGASTCGH